MWRSPARARPLPAISAPDEPLAAANAARHDWIAEEGRQNRQARDPDYRRISDLKASRTDPDASLMHRSKGGSHLGYHTHYVVDGGKARIILQALVTPSEVMENQPMLDLLWRSTFRWKIRPRQVTGDTTYGTLRNITAIEQAGIRAYVPLSDYDGRRPFFGKNDFLYDPERDVYVCPQGQPLRFAQPPTHLPGGQVPGRRRHLQRRPREAPMHDEPPRAHAAPQPRRGVLRAGTRLPRDRTLQEGAAEAEGMGGATLRRG